MKYILIDEYEQYGIVGIFRNNKELNKAIREWNAECDGECDLVVRELEGDIMNRLTFYENKDSYGVVGMNESNVSQKIHDCIKKLIAYEDVGLNPDEVLKLIFKIDELESKLKTIEMKFEELKENVI